ncbi:MAG: hypothetical protein LC775_13945, partial [Acidobacteria bacterium]|nr:hypothetical protein [Acidobacteriota bacterium]
MTSRHGVDRKADEVRVRAELLRRAEQETEAAREELAAALRTAADAGLSLRELGSLASLSHSHVRNLVQSTLGRDSSIEIVRPPDVPEAVSAFGEPVEAQVYFSASDALICAGKHPKYFLSAHGIRVPTMQLINKSGDRLGVDDCNSGYGGTGPHNSERVLLMTGFQSDAAKHVFSKRILHLARDQADPLLAERASRTDLRLGNLHVDEERLKVIIGRESMHQSQLQERLTGDSVIQEWQEWLEHVFNAKPPLSWAEGQRSARYYLDQRKAMEDGFVKTEGGWTTAFTLILQQGQLQLWLPVPSPYHPAQQYDPLAMEVLSAAGFDVDKEHPGGWFTRAIARIAGTASFIDLASEEGETVSTPRME